MNRRDVFDAWAPPGGLWTPWVKAVVFAHLDAELAPAALVKPFWARAGLFHVPDDSGYRTTSRPSCAVVVDLPGLESVAAGVALFDLGFQPVPLYTSIPGLPAEEAASLVKMVPLVRGLLAGAERLRARPLSPDAPPAFLLDADRDGAGVPVMPWRFDNRSVSFPTDFPSAVRLKDASVERVVLIQAGRDAPRPDLAAKLLECQKAGLPAFLLRTDLEAESVEVRPLKVSRPGWLTMVGLWLHLQGLHGNREQGFGVQLPPPQAG